MKIYLPHLHYTVLVKKFKKAPPQKPAAQAYTERIDKHTVAIYLPDKDLPGNIAHELIHVLYYLCIDRDMDFTDEKEHMAYIMHYLLGKIMGHEWKA